VKISTLADLLSIVSGIALWIPAYRASLIKLGQSRFTVPPEGSGHYPSFKRWLRSRYDNREREWTDRHHTLLIAGFALLILSSVLNLLFS
jgi:hypothetical protein